MDVFQILIFLVIIGVGLFKTLRKQQSQTTHRKVRRKTAPVNPFPLEEEMPEEEKMPEKVQMTPSPDVRKKKHVLKQEKQRKKANKENSERPIPVQGKPSEEHPSGYAFRTPSDARRAFIYSEIFRRKYD